MEISPRDTSVGKKKRSLIREGRDIHLASDMVRLGARLQVLQAETDLSYDRLTRLYREIQGVSPPKGMLPFSADWFMTWLPNIHASLFYSVYTWMNTHTAAKKTDALVQAYKVYLADHAYAGRAVPGGEPVMSFTRAWMLVRFFDGGLLQLTTCENCKGQFIAHAHDPQKGYVCGICRPPPRAGKTRAQTGSYPGVERRSETRPE